MKVFEDSAHVMHYQKYPKEYIAQLYSFLDKLQLIQDKEKIIQRM